MSVDPLLLTPPSPGASDPTAALRRIAATADDLRALARAEGQPMLDYLLGMVALEASTQLARQRNRPTPPIDDA